MCRARDDAIGTREARKAAMIDKEWHLSGHFETRSADAPLGPAQITAKAWAARWR
jgi:hypothetical protein